MTKQEFINEITKRPNENASQTLLRQLNTIIKRHNEETKENLTILDGLYLAISCKNKS